MQLQKAFEDLEFDKLIQAVLPFANTASATERLRQTELYQELEPLRAELKSVEEFLLSFSNLPIPGLQSEEIEDELYYLGIEGSVLDAEALLKISGLCKAVNHLLTFLKKQEEIYPHLLQRCSHIPLEYDVSQSIDSIIDIHGLVKSTASRELASIRKKLTELRRQVERTFQAELVRYRQAGFLDDTKETFLNGRRVLAVMAEFKRRIGGTVLGSSNSGKLAFIEPAASVPLNNEIGFLEQEERDEIHRILKALCAELRLHLERIRQYQEMLVDMDLVRAKAKLADQLNACLPELIDRPHLELYQAYHPLLFLENKREQLPTKAQDLVLHASQRILVISGPNAGGKSITLKTAGLLQLMFQSGFLVPVLPHSKMGLFTHILTDIGDNQSIENKLSTYSYRLQNMKHFLRVADNRSLFLIDEFGTGSDPELGGALAEVFFEELYGRKSLGAITTHYANIKLLVDQLPEAINASMLFDRESLEPLFELSVGQPGSSFTFEVAQKNAIPLRLIKEARQRVDSGKLRLDETIAALQREKGHLTEQTAALEAEKQRLISKEEDFDFRKEEYEFKLLRLQQTQHDNNEFINYGRRLKEWVTLFNGKNTKQVIGQFVKWLKMEASKKAPKPAAKLAPISKQKEKHPHVGKRKRKPVKRELHAGDRVQLAGGTEVGELQEVKNQQATVLFGNFKLQVSLKELQLAEDEDAPATAPE